MNAVRSLKRLGEETHLMYHRGMDESSRRRRITMYMMRRMSEEDNEKKIRRKIGLNRGKKRRIRGKTKIKKE